MKVGLFGGAFDPVHNAHLFIAEAVRVRETLDRVVFLPTRTAHHREALRAPLEHRAAMLRLAIASNPAFALDLADAADEATGYTADLLPRLRERYPDDELSFIVGSDSLVRSRWRRFDEVLAMLDAFYVAPREDIGKEEVEASLRDLPAALRRKVRFTELPRAAESATLVRELLETGESVRYLVPEAVWRYLSEHGLYSRRGAVAK